MPRPSTIDVREDFTIFGNSLFSYSLQALHDTNVMVVNVLYSAHVFFIRVEQSLTILFSRIAYFGLVNIDMKGSSVSAHCYEQHITPVKPDQHCYILSSALHIWKI